LQHTTRLDSDSQRHHSASWVFLVGIVTLLILATANSLCAQTGRQLFVSTGGNDANSGSQLQPFRTIQHAADIVLAGDVVTVADGVYTATGTGTACAGQPIVCVTRGGSAGNLVTFRAEHAGGAKLDGQNNTNTDGVVFQSTANYVVIDGFELYGVGNGSGSSSGFEVYNGGHDSVISHNHIHDVGRLCTNTSNGEVGIFIEQPNVRVEGNTIHDIGRFAPGENGCSPSNSYYQNHDHGVYVDGDVSGSGIPGGNNTFIANNVFYNNARGWAIQIYPGTLTGLSILNNTFAFPNPYQDGHIILGANTSNSRITNNIFYSPHGSAIDYYTGTQSNLQVTENLVFNATLLTSTPSGTLVASNQVADPMLTSVTLPYDFRPKTGSPAINAGVTLVEVPVDINGAPRNDGLYDIGAYEGSGAVQQTAAAPTITPNGGIVTNPISVALATTTVGATIRYTLDGTMPTSTSPAYSAPFTVAGGLTVRAKAVAAGMIDSPVSQATFQVPVTADTVPPTVSFTSPQDGATVRRWMTFSVAASDNVAVASVVFTVDGRAIATDTSAPYAASYSFRHSGSGPHVVTAIATDTSGNTASASITVWR